MDGDPASVTSLYSELRQFQDAATWMILRSHPWEEVRVKEAKLRTRFVEAVASGLHSGEDSMSEVISHYPDLLRPPWTPDLPQRVAECWAKQQPKQAQAAGEDQVHTLLSNDVDVKAALDVLGTVDCHEAICGDELCWHCWHLAECGSRPSELEALLNTVPLVSAAAAPSHRARIIEQRWSFFEALAEIVELAVSIQRSALADGASQDMPSVLVLGGIGVSAVRAARAGAHVIQLEGNDGVVAALHETFQRNDVQGCVDVVQDMRRALESMQKASRSSFSIVVVEGLEPDGILGCGAINLWRSALANGMVGSDTLVLPSSLHFTAALSEVRLREAGGVAIDLEPFAEAYGGLSPLPCNVAGGSATAVAPRALTNPQDLMVIQLQHSTYEDAVASSVGSSEVSFYMQAKSGKPDAVLVGCTAKFCVPRHPDQDIDLGRMTYALPAALSETSPITVQAPFARTQLLDWYSEMMNDSPRNLAFHSGIQEAIAHVHDSGRSTCRVADLGCGAGVLSCMAMRSGASDIRGIEITPHLARCARNVLAKNQGKDTECNVEVRCADIRTAVCDADEDRYEIVVAELLDAGGLGERLIPFMQHAKAHLLQKDGKVIPHALRIYAMLADVSLPKVGSVDCNAFVPFWLPAQAAAGEWLALDLDAGASWKAISKPVPIISVNFEDPLAKIAASLREKTIVFPIDATADSDEDDSSKGENRQCNCIVWWFEADTGAVGPPLCSAPRRFRPLGSEATHWAQAVAHVGPWMVDSRSIRSIHIHMRTDGTHLTWTPCGAELVATEKGSGERQQHIEAEAVTEQSEQSHSQLQPLQIATVHGEGVKLAAKSIKVSSRDAMDSIRTLRNTLDQVGDIARLHALQAAVLCIAAQPGLFGIEATQDAVVPFLKEFFM